MTYSVANASAGTFHFMGIGGVGMAGLAFLLKKRGADVSGCDKYLTPRTQWLAAAGIDVAAGHDVAHLDAAATLVITPAVPPDTPERATAVARGLRVRCRGELLAELVNALDGIAVCGTHGKTTTATFTAKLLRALGDDPAWCIGGETGALPVAGVPARTDLPDAETPFVVEADESDGTLACYRARTLVITSLDYDHPEHFKTPEAYRACFAQAEAQARDVIRAWELDATDWPELDRLVCGAHNVANARAAIEVALRRGHPRAAIAAALPEALAALPDRRFQTLWPTTPEEKAGGVTVITDYAHHPAELACALAMARAQRPTRVRVLFQPHRYSRTRTLKDQFPDAFTAADEVVLIPVYPAFEPPLPGGDIADLYLAFRRRQEEAAAAEVPARWPDGLRLARSAEEAWRHVFLTRAPGDLILLAGAGDIIRLVPRVRADLARAAATDGSRAPTAPRALCAHTFFKTGGYTYGGGEEWIVGQGSNTWFSDCACDLELRTAPACGAADGTVPAGLAGARLLAPDSPWRDALAFMSGIPGTVGGWVKMNAGAFGHTISEVVASVTVEAADGTVRTLPAAACRFGYRTSAIDGLIRTVTFKPAAPSAGASPEDYRARRKAFPPRTCGSVFKNPSPGNPAGALLDEAGARGLRVGGAYVWEEHANVIVAGAEATASDILALARLMAQAVYHKFGIVLEPEIRGLVTS